MRLPVVVTLVAALLTGSVATALASSPPPSSVRTENSVETLALEWFAQMQTGSDRPYAIGCRLQCPVDG
jgi:hypothetical protein